MMNIGQLMKGILGHKPPSENPTAELKQGQVVRGVLVEMTDSEHAIIQINGTAVQAKLETPMQPGQSALLQVQSAAASGQLVLKRVDDSAGQLSEGDLKAVLKGLGLPDDRAMQSLVQSLQREGISLTRPLGLQLQQAVQAMSDQLGNDVFSHAVMLAAKREIPLTEAALRAIQQAVGGPSLDQLLARLNEGLASWPAGQNRSSGIGQLLAEGARLMQMAAVRAPLDSLAGGQPLAGQAGIQQGQGQGDSGQSALDVRAAGKGGNVQGASPLTENLRAHDFAGADSRQAAGERIKGLLKWLGADHERVLAQLVKGAEHSQGKASHLLSHEQEGGNATQLRSGQSQEIAAGRPIVPAYGGGLAALNTPNAASVSNGAYLPHAANRSHTSNAPNTANSAGTASSTGTESSAGTASNAGTANAASAANSPNTAGDAANAAGGSDTVQSRNAPVQLQNRFEHQAELLRSIGEPTAGKTDALLWAQRTESLKSVLLNLLATQAHEMPAALRETAEQLVQHITGQQLLLLPERSAAPVTQLTMMIPLQLQGEAGNQTATVHIQTRKGRKGELDQNNCRLVFDLRMRSLGETIVDMHVVDKIVSITVWNQHEAMAELAGLLKDGVAEAFSQAGYQLLTLRALPLAERKGEQGEKEAAVGTMAEWSSKPYKGVDYRI